MLIDIRNAKKNFSKIIEQVLKGDEFIIVENSKPLIRLIPYIKKSEVRRGGQLAGLIQISDDFDAPLPKLS